MDIDIGYTYDCPWGTVSLSYMHTWPRYNNCNATLVTKRYKLHLVIIII